MAHPNMMIDDGRFFIMRYKGKDQEISPGGLYVRRGMSHVCIGRYGINTDGQWHARIAENLTDAAQGIFKDIAIVGIDTLRNDAIYTLWSVRHTINIVLVDQHNASVQNGPAAQA